MPDINQSMSWVVLYHDITEILLNSFKMWSYEAIFCPVSNKDVMQRGQMPKCPQSLDFPFYFDAMFDFFSVLMIRLSSDCQMEIRCLPILYCSTFVFTQYKFVKWKTLMENPIAWPKCLTKNPMEILILFCYILGMVYMKE